MFYKNQEFLFAQEESDLFKNIDSNIHLQYLLRGYNKNTSL
jgi:hypothetical protein